jgi:leucyl-tRNA synthetase
MQKYDPAIIEPKWQQVWEETKLYAAVEDPDRTPVYATPMLPYPSGAGLHVGHVRNYSISDTVARFHRQRGRTVLNAIGWDAFGLPAENYAIKTGIHPAKVTKQNIETFKHQLKRIGISIDWDCEISTADPEYYRWTQWVFLQLYKHGLAYQAKSLQWWCPECKTVLANEQVVNGCCWRHEDTPVIKKRLKQWFFKITDYADQLLDGIEDLDWPESIKAMQRNWIGRSHGAEILFDVQDSTQQLKVFTTRPDTLYGATFVVVAPEYEQLQELVTAEQKADVEHYVTAALARSDVERMDENRERTGVFTGAYAINPLNNQPVPIWVADYVLAGYGTGAIMAVPAHDQRDNEFAKTFDLPIVTVIESPKDNPEQAVDRSVYSGEGALINSGDFSGTDSATARDAIIEHLQQQQRGSSKTNYKIRDWLISRQRYWGAPIPMIHCAECGTVPVPEADLPVELPVVDDFAPKGDGKSVLARAEEWVKVTCPSCGGKAERETDTMDGYACSSWYMMRYTDPHNQSAAWDPKKLNYWWPVDFYFGGDHAVSHLLYFRFWNRFFYDQGLVNEPEPVKRLVFNGYINAEDGSKMSKSKGNVVDPLDVIESGYGADALRLFELFIAPYDQDTRWNTNGVPGTYRFLQRYWALSQEWLAMASDGGRDITAANTELQTQIAQAEHRTIKQVTEDLERLSFNTAIAHLMKYSNTLTNLKKELPLATAPTVWRSAIENGLRLLAPFAPHMTEELWQQFGHEQSIHTDGWPDWDEDLVAAEMVSIVIQVNGKLRAQLEVASDTGMDEIITEAKQIEKLEQYLTGKTIVKTITVPGRLINFVVK